MARLKAYQVAAAALAGGFPASQVPTAVAVARGESSFNTGAENACCTGLWQIHRKAHADKIAAAGGADALKDPVVNARVAHQIWAAAGGWCTSGRIGSCNPWQAYGLNNGGMSWKAKLAEGARAYAEVQRRQRSGEPLATMAASNASSIPKPDLNPFDIPNPLDTGGSIAGLAKAIIDFGNRIGGWIGDPQNWIRVAEVVGGAVLITVGLRVAFNKPINAMTRQVLGVVLPGGKAGKVAAAAAAVKQGKAT